MSSIDWALQLGRQQDCLPEPWNAAGAVHQCCLVFLSQGLHSGSLLPSPLGADQANLHLSLQSPLLPSLALLVCAERRGPHFLNHYFLIPFSRKNSSLPLHPLGFFLTAAVISTPAPKLKSHRSCQSHGTGPFPAMQVEITNIFFFTPSLLSSSRVLPWLMLCLKPVKKKTVSSTYRAKALQNGSHLLHGKLAVPSKLRSG